MAHIYKKTAVRKAKLMKMGWAVSEIMEIPSHVALDMLYAAQRNVFTFQFNSKL